MESVSGTSSADLEAQEQLNQIAEKNAKEVENKENQAPTAQSAANSADLEAKIDQIVEEKLKAEQAPKQEEAAPTKPALNLKNISKKDLEKKDKKLVEKHFKDDARNAQWDSSRQVVILHKSDKWRVYKLGAGAAPALFESKSHKDAKNFVNNL